MDGVYRHKGCLFTCANSQLSTQVSSVHGQRGPSLLEGSPFRVSNRSLHFHQTPKVPAFSIEESRNSLPSLP